MQPEPAIREIAIRLYDPTDSDFLASVAHRLLPGETVSPRATDVMERYFASLANESFPAEPESEAFVATVDDVPLGVIAVRPDADYFTGHARAYVDILVVVEEAEGQGVGKALMRFAKEWAREHDCHEVVLDVFAGNSAAIAFYERCGYRPDHFRMAKPLV